MPTPTSSVPLFYPPAIPTRFPRYSQPYQMKPRYCIFCNSDLVNHFVSMCEAFKTSTNEVKHTFIREKGLCSNSLRPGHELIQCPYFGRCRICNEKHHTSLHEMLSTHSDIPSDNYESSSSAQPQITNNAFSHQAQASASIPPNQS